MGLIWRQKFISEEKTSIFRTSSHKKIGFGHGVCYGSAKWQVGRTKIGKGWSLKKLKFFKQFCDQSINTHCNFLEHNVKIVRVGSWLLEGSEEEVQMVFKVDPETFGTWIIQACTLN
jgi:hypothetical protein